MLLLSEFLNMLMLWVLFIHSTSTQEPFQTCCFSVVHLTRNRFASILINPAVYMTSYASLTLDAWKATSISTFQVYFLLFYERNYSNCVMGSVTYTEHWACRHRQRTEAAHMLLMLTLLCRHSVPLISATSSWACERIQAVNLNLQLTWKTLRGFCHLLLPFKSSL